MNAQTRDQLPPELLARIVEVFYSDQEPKKARARAIKYWKKYLSALETQKSHPGPSSIE